MADFYRTIETPTEGIFKEKMSKFYSFAIPVNRTEEVKAQLEAYQKRFYDARHLCYAYVLGPRGEEFRANDNGEPSGTAGRPILGQIHSMELTNILVIVVRYFGGIKLGTGGLIVAYREAAAEALREARVVEKTIDGSLVVSFTYPFLNDVMRIIKEMNPVIVRQRMEQDCEMQLSIREGELTLIADRLQAIDYTLQIKLL